jgi:hypothetical protein
MRGHHGQKPTPSTNIKYRAPFATLRDDPSQCPAIELIATSIIQHDIMIIILEERFLVPSKGTCGEN